MSDEQIQFEMDFRRFDWLYRQWLMEQGVDPEETGERPKASGGRGVSIDDL